MTPPRSELLALLRTARESFDEPVPLLVVADWLEEHGDTADQARAAWIRLWAEPERAAKPGWEERRNVIEAAHGEAWITPRMRDLRAVSHFGPMLALSLHADERLGPAEEAARDDPERWAWVGHMTLVCTAANAPRAASSPLLGHCARLTLICEAGALPVLRTAPRFAAIKDLRLSFHPRTGDDFALALAAGLPDVERLDLSHNEAGEAGLDAIAAAPPFLRLRELELAKLRSRSGLVLGLARLFASSSFPALEKLDLSGNRLGVEGLQGIAAGPLLGRLRSLDLRGCGIGVRGLRLLADSPHIRPECKLSLADNPIGAGGARQAARLAGSLLPDIYLGKCDIDAHGAAALAASPAIRQARLLSLHSNELGDEGAVALARREWPALEELYLTGCRIGPEGAAALAGSPGFPHLRALSLGFNPFVDDGVMALARGKGLPRLADLDLDGITITEAAVAALRERYGTALRT